MAASLGRLTLDLVTRISSFTEPLERAERQAKKSTDVISSSFDRASASVKKMAATIATVAASYVSLDKIIEVQRNFDKLNASLITSTGSAKNASVAFSALQQFAQTTPYGLNQSVEAFTKLVNLGLTPSSRALTSYGNTAAAMGKDLDQMIEAVADATTGEFERLKEFGIKSSQQGGKVALTFQGTTKVIENSSKAIEDYLLRIGEVNFAGAMENRMKTLDGSIANLEDTFEAFLLKVSQSGIGDAVKVGVDNASDALALLSQNLDKVEDVALVVGSIFAGKVVGGLTQATMATIVNIVAEKNKILTNYEIARSELAATAAMVRSMGVTNAETVAMMANARAAFQKASAAKAAAFSGGLLSVSGAGLLSVLGGPVGLGVTVLSLAAGYLLMKKSTDVTTSAIDAQGQSIADITKKYDAMSASQKQAFSYGANKDLAEKTKEYAAAKAAFYDSAVGIAYQSANSDAAVKSIDDLVAKFKSGKITALEFADGMSQLGIYTKEQIATAVQFAEKTDSAKTALDGQKKIVDSLSTSTDVLTQFQKKQINTLTEQARVLGLNAEQWSKLSKAQQEYATKVASDVGRQAYIAENMKNGKMTREQAEFMADQHEGLGVSFYTPFNRSQQQVANKAWGVTRNFALDPNERKAFAKVQSNAALYNFSEKEKNYGLPAGLLSAIMMNESRGDTYRNGKLLTSESGAQGSFQFLPGTAKRYGVDVTSVESSAAGAAKYLQYLYKRFGDWDSAIAAYHAGEGNVEKGTNIGPRTKGYVLNANKYVAAANGKSAFDTSLSMPSQAEMLAQKAAFAQSEKDLADKKLEINKKYFNKYQQAAQDNKDAIKSINSTMTGSELTTALAKQAELYKSQLDQIKAAEKDEYNQLHAFETDRITQLKREYAVKKMLAEADVSKTPAQRKDDVATLDRQMQAEIDAVKRQEAQQVLSAKQATMDSIELMKQQYAIERDEIVKNKGLSDKAREQILAAKDADFQHNLKNAELERDARILAAQEGLLTESAMVVARYQLEHEQLKNITGISKEEIDARLAYQELAQQKSLKKLVEDNQKAYREAYNSALGLPTNQFDVNHQTIKGLQKGSNELRDSQLGESQNAQDNLTTGLTDQYSQGLISEQEYQTQLTDIVRQGEDERAQIRADAAQREQDIQNVSKQLQLQTELSYGEQISGSMAETMKGAFGEQSAAYKAAFAVQKAFAIAQSMVAIQTGIALAAGQPFPENLAAMASVAAATASIISNISSVATGFATGGYTGSGGKYDVAGIVHKGEVVWSQEDVARSGGVGAVERARRGGISGYADGGVVGSLVGFDASTSQSKIASALTESSNTNQGANITINNNSGAQVNAQQNSDGSISIDVVDQMIKRSWQQLGNANSRESKSLARNTTARRNR